MTNAGHLKQLFVFSDEKNWWQHLKDYLIYHFALTFRVDSHARLLQMLKCF